MKLKANKQKVSRVLVSILAVTLIFSLGYISGYSVYDFKLNAFIAKSASKMNPKTWNVNVKTDLINEILTQLNENYISKDLDYKKISYGMAEGIVRSLDDKYTVFLSPEDNQQYKDDRTTELEGIGVVLTFNGEFTEVETVLEGYPAQLAGIESGDLILEVDGEEMTNQKPPYVSSKVKGKAGTTVNLKLFRLEADETIDKTLERTKIELKNIEFKKIDNVDNKDNLFNVKVNRFIDDSVEEFDAQWDEIVKTVCASPDNKIIMDLRYNPGGYVNSALYMLEDFVPNDTLLMKEVDRDNNEYPRYSTREPRCKDNEVVVLINSSSASAAEIFVGALKDHKRAYLIGEKTVGKGLEQKVIDLSDGSAMHVVFRKWTTPNGFNPTNEDPITPDLIIEEKSVEEVKPEDRVDEYMEKAKEYLNK